MLRITMSVSGEGATKYYGSERGQWERYTVLEAEARDLVKKTGMDFADVFAQVKGKLGAESREAKSVVPRWVPKNSWQIGVLR